MKEMDLSAARKKVWDSLAVLRRVAETEEATYDTADRIRELEQQVEKLKATLKPFASLWLYPYDIEGQLEFEKENNDWSEQENDDVIDDFFIRRGAIRNARKVLEE